MGSKGYQVWLRMGKAISMLSGESVALETLRARQNLGLTLHRETARAILRRSPAVMAQDLLCPVNEHSDE